jgi:creatinine amidohydrolase
VIINGHGGNRGILDNLIHELSGDFALNVCVVHPFELSKVQSDAGSVDVHGGRNETSVMLALAPQLVRRSRMATRARPPEPGAVEALVLDRGVSFAWRTDDPRLTSTGAIGDAQTASPQLGHAIIDSVVTEMGGVLARLLENQRLRSHAGGRA